MNKIPEGYKLTEVGVIPVDWDIKTVRDAFEICNNLRFPISENVRSKMRGEYPYYGPTKIQDYLNEFRVEGEFALIGEDGDHFLKWRDNAMTQIANGGVSANGFTVTGAFVTGGGFSTDGVHPSPRGYALIANKFIEAINSTYGSNLKGVDLGNYRILFPSTL